MSDEAEEVLSETHDFGERYVEVKAWLVPESNRYPEGIKYTMQFGTTDGETIVRYDNFPDHPGVDRHHKHVESGRVKNVEFDGLPDLYRQFKSEVSDRGFEW